MQKYKKTQISVGDIVSWEKTSYRKIPHNKRNHLYDPINEIIKTKYYGLVLDIDQYELSFNVMELKEKEISYKNVQCLNLESSCYH